MKKEIGLQRRNKQYKKRESQDTQQKGLPGYHVIKCNPVQSF